MLRELGVEDVEPWIDVLVELRTGGGREPLGAPPYLGLEAFGHDDADRFFGREALRDRAVARLRSMLSDPDRAGLLLLGASGSGKSSLLRAGIGRLLHEQGHPSATLTPGDRPVERLHAALDALPDDRSRRLPVLPIDQVEELFTAGSDGTQV